MKKTLNIKSALILTFITVCAMTASACTSTLTPLEQQQRERCISEKKEYSVSGKLGIFDEKIKTTTLLNIDVNRPDYTIYISGTTGTTLLKIRKTSSVTEITDDKGNVRSGTNADELVYSLTGLHIPCDSLPDIITAVPGNNRAVYSEKGTIESISFSGFKVVYKSFTEVKGILLPKKMDIQGDNFLLRISVNKWNI